jgi:enoyl-CoA hydratase/carnithine racemase/sugar phosphate isomerase/epimerase
VTAVGLDLLSLNEATVKTLTLAEAARLCVRHDIPAIGLWRDRVAEAGLAESAAIVRDAGLHVSSLCRGGFFTHADPDARAAALADNRAAIAEAAELGADTLILVSGGLVPGRRDLGLARRLIADAIGDLVPTAQRLGVRLGIEALHPVFCADRCVISSLGEAVDLAQRFPSDAVGVVVDTYHVWWDARLFADIARAATRIVSYQVSDWVLPLPQDTLLGRGHVGDGVIDFPPISAAVRAAGYRGYVEVEIFNAEIWNAPPDETAATVRARFPAAAIMLTIVEQSATRPAVRVERSGPVTTVLLHRPDRRNAVDGATAAALAAAFRAFDADPDAAVAVLHGEGGVFCAGADLTAIGTDRGNRVAADGDGPMGVSRLRLSKPVIAAISGYAVAGGLELALWCDLRVADETAVFGVFCRRWGVPLIDGGTVRLPRLIGTSRTMDMILTGRGVDAAEAAAIGLANRVVPAGQALAAAQTWQRSSRRFRRSACAATAPRYWLRRASKRAPRWPRSSHMARRR